MNSRPSLLNRPASVMPTAADIELARFHAAVNTLLLSARADARSRRRATSTTHPAQAMRIALDPVPFLDLRAVHARAAARREAVRAAARREAVRAATAASRADDYTAARFVADCLGLVALIALTCLVVVLTFAL